MELYERLYGRVLKFALRRTEDEAVAEDVVAETWTAAWECMCAGGEVQGQWLFAVARNKIADHFRQTGKERLWIVSEEVSDEAAGVDLLDADEVRALRSVLLTLPHEDQDLVAMTYWDRLNAADVAKILDCSVPAVWKRLSRIRRRLKALLSAEGVEEAIDNAAPASVHGMGGQ